MVFACIKNWLGPILTFFGDFVLIKFISWIHLFPWRYPIIWLYWPCTFILYLALSVYDMKWFVKAQWGTSLSDIQTFLQPIDSSLSFYIWSDLLGYKFISIDSVPLPYSFPLSLSASISLYFSTSHTYISVCVYIKHMGMKNLQTEILL